MGTASSEEKSGAYLRMKISSRTLRALVELKNDIAAIRHRDRAQFSTAGVSACWESESGNPMDGAKEPTSGSAGGR